MLAYLHNLYFALLVILAYLYSLGYAHAVSFLQIIETKHNRKKWYKISPVCSFVEKVNIVVRV